MWLNKAFLRVRIRNLPTSLLFGKSCLYLNSKKCIFKGMLSITSIASKLALLLTIGVSAFALFLQFFAPFWGPFILTSNIHAKFAILFNSESIKKIKIIIGTTIKIFCRQTWTVTKILERMFNIHESNHSLKQPLERNVSYFKKEIYQQRYLLLWTNSSLHL